MVHKISNFTHTPAMSYLKRADIFRYLSSLILVSLCVLSTSLYAATLSSKVDRSNISMDETVQLTITLSGDNTNETPQYQLLESDFDVLSTNQSTMMQHYNGRMNTSTDWTVMLAPKRTGRLTIPSFKVKGAISNAVELNVSPSAAHVPGSQQDIFITTEVNKSTSYVQEQIKLVHRLTFLANINIDQLDAEPLALNDTVIEQLPDTKYQKSINGRTYYVFEYSYAIFPQTSGELVIPALRWNLRIAKSGGRQSIFNRMGNYELKRHKTQEKQITVKPKPIIFPADQAWLPAERLVLEEKWSQDPSTFIVGEPITRTITVQAHGLTSAQLPKFVDDISSSDIKYYSDQPVLKDSQKEEGVISQRIESAAIVAATTGELTIPGKEIPWWNTQADRLEYLYIEPRTITVSGSTTSANTPTNTHSQALNESQVASSSQPTVAENDSFTTRVWPFISALLFIYAVAISYLYFIVSPKTASSKPKDNNDNLRRSKSYEAKAWAELKNSLDHNEHLVARKHLLVWYSLLMNRETHTIEALMADIHDEKIVDGLKKMEASLYSGTETSNIETDFIDALADFRKKINKPPKSADLPQGGLAQLHPTNS